MQRKLKIGDTIQTKAGPAQITRVGPVTYGERSPHKWAMLTLAFDNAAQPSYAVAREDELDESAHRTH